MASLLPVAMLMTWMAAHFEYRPPTPRQHLEVELRSPHVAVGNLAHLVPLDGIEAIGGYVRRIESGSEQGRPLGRARWTVAAEARGAPYELILRCGDRSLRHTLLVGQVRYADPEQSHPDQWMSRVILAEYHPFQVVPGWAMLQLPPWLLAYLTLTVAAFYLLKTCLRVV
jgi:hypothetical protein